MRQSPMTAGALRDWRGRQRLTQTEAAHLIGSKLRTWQNWEGEERAIPPPVHLLLLAIEHCPELRRYLEQLTRKRATKA